jgi:cytidylate kinase
MREMEIRDRQDSERQLAPTKRADDAILIDTSEMSIREVVDVMIDVIRQREQVQPSWSQSRHG